MNLNKATALNDVVFDAKTSAAVNYVKARYAIEAEDSGLSNRKERRDAKMAVVAHLGGKLDHKVVKGKSVTVVIFNDNTKANF